MSELLIIIVFVCCSNHRNIVVLLKCLWKGVPTFNVTLRKCKNSLMYRFRNSCNEIIRAMYSSDIYFKSTLICHILESTHVWYLTYVLYLFSYYVCTCIFFLTPILFSFFLYMDTLSLK